MAERVFGSVTGISEGSHFDNRQALAEAGVHRPLQAGISGSGAEGADSIVVSGGYEDDEDHGDVLIYTGHGGNDPAARRQIADQELTKGNLALAKSCTDGLPVRVVRGAGGHAAYSPVVGYRYEGLYRVESYWQELGRAGYRIWRYRLVKEPSAEPGLGETNVSGVTAPMDTHLPPARVLTQVQRVVRNTAVVQAVKQLHDYRCQLCGQRIETAVGPYAEGAHIRPLGRPHDGPDVPDNVLCLCPNDHVRFDYGDVFIGDDLWLVDRTGAPCGMLRTVRGHPISREQLAYHRRLFALDKEAGQ